MKVCDVLEHMEAVGDQRKRANSISCGNETEFGTGRSCHIPTMISMKKKIMSMTSKSDIRVERDSAMGGGARQVLMRDRDNENECLVSTYFALFFCTQRLLIKNGCPVDGGSVGRNAANTWSRAGTGCANI